MSCQDAQNGPYPVQKWKAMLHTLNAFKTCLWINFSYVFQMSDDH